MGNAIAYINEHGGLLTKKKFIAKTRAVAFTLNALITSIIAITTVSLNDLLEDSKNTEKMNVHLRRFISLLIGFSSGLITYWIFFFLFGFGGGMLA